jgi:3'-phosphoadenosine 5'-phosphosulfate sulfotransferase
MISGFGLWGLAKGVLGTFWGRAIAVALAALVALKVNNVIQRSVGEKRGIAKVVTKANTKAKERNAQVRKIGDSIDPATAMQRLRSEYPDSDSN